MMTKAQTTKDRMTVPKFTAMKAARQRITMLTAYDFTTAKLLDQAGVDSILIGDSLGMVVQGHETTLPVTLDQMIYHSEMVGRAVSRALLIVDLPFPCYHLGLAKAIENAGRVLKETQCQAVKLEGGAPQAEVIAGLVAAGIPVMAHVGLRPQNIHQLGGYKVFRDEAALLNDAQMAQDAGAFGIVLECIPRDLAARLTKSLEIPTIGIGAGPDCDGQVLVINDILGLSVEYVPRHVRKYADLNATISAAVSQFCHDVQQGAFPGEDNAFN